MSLKAHKVAVLYNHNLTSVEHLLNQILMQESISNIVFFARPLRMRLVVNFCYNCNYNYNDGAIITYHGPQIMITDNTLISLGCFTRSSH